MKRAIRLGLVCLSMLGVAGSLGACGGSDQSESEDLGSVSSPLQGKGRQLSFDNYTPALVSGAYGKLEFSSSQSVDGNNVQFWHKGGLVGQLNYDMSTDTFTVDVEFTNVEKKLAADLTEALKGLDENEVLTTFGPDAGDTALGQLFSAASHYSTAPSDKAYHQTRKLHDDPEAMGMSALAISGYWGDSGIRYLWECKRTSSYKYSTAYWTDYRGYLSVFRTCGTASVGCAGRCGGGCPCNYWYCANRYYTDDCFGHDTCLDYNPGDTTTSPFAPNCGDEWLDAADDFIFGSSSGW